jgi:hypothetical protein
MDLKHVWIAVANPDHLELFLWVEVNAFKKKNLNIAIAIQLKYSTVPVNMKRDSWSVCRRSYL